MPSGRAVVTAVLVGALAGALLGFWKTVASALDQGPTIPASAVASPVGAHALAR